MTAFQIYGGVPLQGEVLVQGSKNAALPVMAAALLTGDVCLIKNCPQITDVAHMTSLLTGLGCEVRRTGEGYQIDSRHAAPCGMSGEAITGMRSSLCLLGAMLGRFGEIKMEYPGGCVIGERPIDLHLKTLEQMGVVFEREDGQMSAGAERLHGADIRLPIPSVGVTENLILAAVCAEGDTRISGAALEPEIEALCVFLISCGAVIDGVGSPNLHIVGERKLHGTQFRVPADRIVAGTYLFSCVGCGGNIFLKDAPIAQMRAVIDIAERMGARCNIIADERMPEDRSESPLGYGYAVEQGLYVQGPERPLSIDRLRTQVYPGFPTDLQSVALAVLTCAEGDSIVEETIFENRFRVLDPLKAMGADVEQISPEKVFIRGVDRLYGANVEAKELRGGAALVTAGLMAEGMCEVSGCGYIERGYENICKDLKDLGARIVSV